MPFCTQCGQKLPNDSVFCSECGNRIRTPDMHVESQPQIQYPSGFSFASFWARVGASFLDGIICSVVGLLVAFVIGFLIANYGSGPNAQIGAIVIAYVVIWLGQWLYFALMESSNSQATVGKKSLNLIVTDLDGRPISFGRASARFFAKLVSALILGIGFLFPLFTEKKQALHDLIAGTLVVQASR